MSERAIAVTLLVGLCCLTAGWSLHARWMFHRVRIHAVWGQSGPVEWLVTLGRPIVGKFGTREEATHHADRIRNALIGRAEERRQRESHEGQSNSGGAEGPQS